MKEKFKQKTVGIMLGSVLLAANAAFIWFLHSTHLIPLKLLLIGAAILFVITVGIFFLAINAEKTWRSLIACTLSLLMVSTQTFAVDLLSTGTKTLEEITNVKTEYAEVGVYVRTEDPAKDVADLKGYKFGILKTLDRNMTDKAVENIMSFLGNEITITEYETVDETADALINLKEVDAIIINKAFLDVLIEIEDYEDALSKMREVYVSEVVDSVTLPEKKPSSSGGGYAEGPLETGTYVKPDPSVKMPEHVLSIYIGGIDCYGSISRRSRSDVNIVAYVNTKTNQILLISTPRDFYVKTPVSGTQHDKLTNAGIYGAKVSAGAMEILFDAEITHHFRVNFTGFQDIIDALGGITVYSSYNFSTPYYTFVKGDNYVSGSKALAFARERKSFRSGDRQRGKNQMEVIKGVIKKATTISTLTKYKKILESVANSMETTIPYEKITELINTQLDTNATWNVTSYSVDGTGSSKKVYSQKKSTYVMVPKETTITKAKSLINQLITDQVPTV